MNLLLDTQVLIWWDEGRRLTVAARRAIETADNVYVSAASGWEVAIEIGLGRLRTSRTVEQAAEESPSGWPASRRTIAIRSTASSSPRPRSRGSRW